MPESVALLAQHDRALGGDEVLAHQLLEAALDGRSLRLGGEPEDGRRPEALADDRGPLDHGPLLGAQAIEAGGEERLDGRGDLQPVPVVIALGEHRDELLDEERVAGAGLGDLRAGRRRQVGLAEQPVDEVGRLVLGQGAEEDRGRVELAPAPAWTLLEQLGTSVAEDEDRRVPRPVDDVLDHVEEGRLAPVDVLEDDDEGPIAGEGLEELAHGPERLLGRRLGLRAADRSDDTLGDLSRRLLVCDQGRDGLLRVALLAGEVADDLEEGEEGDPLAVREAAPGDDSGLAVKRRAQLAGEPRLADPRAAEHGEEVRAPLLDSVLEGLPQLPELAVAADERRVRPTLEGGRAVDHLEEAPREDAVLLSAHDERLDRLDRDHVAHEPEGRLADEDLSRLGRLLEARGDVDRVAGDERLAVLGVAGDDLAGVHPRPQRQPHASLRLQLRVQRLDRRAHLDHGADGAKRVVLMDSRDAEDGHDGVADELLDRPTVALERARGGLEVAGHDAADRLGVELGAEFGRLRDIREDDGHGLPRLT